jgi:acetoacetyl-CoA synthetase
MADSPSLTNAITDLAIELWRHPNIPTTHMWAFMQLINEKYGLTLQTYQQLHRWSIDNIARFWEETWHFTGVRATKGFDLVRLLMYHVK